MKRRVFISSPYRPLSDDPLKQAQEKQQNIQMARAACRLAIHQGCMPIAPHLYGPQFLRDEDPTERRIGIDMGLKAMEDCDELWVIGERISEGMAHEIAHANEIGILIRCISDFASREKDLLAAVREGSVETT